MPHEWVNYKSLRAELSFIEILHHYGVELKERGEQWHGFCPLPTHEGKRQSPSFSANVGRGIWQCFGCGAKGNVIEFATRMEGLNPENPDDFRKTALLFQKMFVGKDGEEREKPRTKVMRERSGQEDLEEERPDSVVNAPLDFALQRLDYSHPSLRERGFTEETVKAFGLGYCERGLMKGRIAIPLHDAKGALIGYAGRIVDGEASGKDTPRYLFPGSRERNGTRHEFRSPRFCITGVGYGVLRGLWSSRALPPSGGLLKPESGTWSRSWALLARKRKPVSCKISFRRVARYGSFPMATMQASGWRKKHS
jgi:hypothetical protein